MNRINFTGELRLNGMETKNPYCRSGKTKSGKDYKSFSGAVLSDVNNRAFFELFGMDDDVIRTMDTDGNKVEIDKTDRFDDDVVKSIASYRKNIVNLIDGDRKEFISAYDAIEYLCENADDINGKRVTVTGTINKNIYNGTISDRFQLQNIYMANENVKNGLKTVINFVWNKDSVDLDDWKSDKKIYINGFTSAYITEEKENKYVPQKLIFDCSKIDFNNEKHIKLVKFKMSLFGCSYEDGNVKCNLKSGKWYNLPFECKYVNGAEVEEFTVDMLTEKQRESYELGLKTLDQLRPSGNIYGDRITEFKIVDADIRGDYEDGYIEIEIDNDEFYKVAKKETVKELEESVITNESFDDEEDDLFG